MNKQPCPCCATPVELVGAGVIESHTRPDGYTGNMRSGRYCEASGYTVEQAQRWSTLSTEQKRDALHAGGHA